MQIPRFDTFAAINHRWDTYRRTHVVDGHFIQFETDEVIYTRVKPDPDDRKLFKSRNVQIVSTTDHDCPPLTTPVEPGKALPRAWLSDGGQQILAIDHEFGVAVGIQHSFSRAVDGAVANLLLTEDLRYRVPAWLSSANLRFTVYWGGPGMPPAGAPVSVSRPLRDTLTAEQLQHLSDTKAQADAWAELMEVKLSGSQAALIGATGERYSIAAGAGGLNPSTVLESTFATLTTQQKLVLAIHGMSARRVPDQYPFLLVCK